MKAEYYLNAIVRNTIMNIIIQEKVCFDSMVTSVSSTSCITKHSEVAEVLASYLGHTQKARVRLLLESYCLP